MRLISLPALGVLLTTCCACEKCGDKSRIYDTDFYAANRRTHYDWDKVDFAEGETIFLGIGTEYYKDCGSTSAQEELLIRESSLWTDTEIVINGDTFPANTNLLSDQRTSAYISLTKDEDAFFNSPQYLIKLDNKTMRLHDYYTFFFKGITEGGYKINDSTIVFIQ